MHHNSATGSLLQDDTNAHVSSPANKSAQLPDEPAKYRDDIELDDNALETIEIKELNQMLKRKNIEEPMKKEIKDRRRRLKNRGKLIWLIILRIYNTVIYFSMLHI